MHNIQSYIAYIDMHTKNFKARNSISLTNLIFYQQINHSYLKKTSVKVMFSKASSPRSLTSHFLPCLICEMSFMCSKLASCVITSIL